MSRLNTHQKLVSLLSMVLLPSLAVTDIRTSEDPISVAQDRETQSPYKKTIKNLGILGTALIATGYGLTLFNIRTDSKLATARKIAALGCLTGGSSLLTSLFARNVWNNAYRNSEGKKTRAVHFKNLINCMDKNLAAAIVFSGIALGWLKEMKNPLKTFVKCSGDFEILNHDD